MVTPRLPEPERSLKTVGSPNVVTTSAAVVSGVMLYFVVTCYGTSDAFIYFQF